MILVTRAPIHITLGTEATGQMDRDSRDTGAVVSAAFNRYVYVIITPGPERGVRIISADLGKELRLHSCNAPAATVELELPQATICYLNMSDGITVFLASQVPAGYGLHTRASMAVALVKGLAFWSGLDLGPTEVAELAYNLQSERLGWTVDRTTVYAAAFGGVNVIRESRNRVEVSPLGIDQDTQTALDAHATLFLGPRNAEQPGKIRQAASNPFSLPEADAVRLALEYGSIHQLGALLYESQARLHTQTTGQWHRAYHLAQEQGAFGGRLLHGAQGHALFLLCPPENQESLIASLQTLDMAYRQIGVEHEGVQALQALPWPTSQSWQESLLVGSEQRDIY
ncbi:MAG: hypothetical protein JXB35_12850 [Anaerolineae bacterium]|nr:hypothetical protein [Anaerolineae bacterium]